MTDLEREIADLLAERAASASPPVDAWDRFLAENRGLQQLNHAAQPSRAWGSIRTRIDEQTDEPDIEVIMLKPNEEQSPKRSWSRSGALTTFTCDYDTVDAPTRAVGAPPVPTTTTFTVTSLGISEMHETYTGRDFKEVGGPFEAWLQLNHPDVEGAGFGEWTTVEEAVEHGGIRAQYSQEWAAHLDEIGCEYVPRSEAPNSLTC